MNTPTTPLTRDEARALAMNVQRRTQDLDISLPGMEALDGQLALQSLTPPQLRHVELLSKQGDEVNEPLMLAGWIAKSLVLRSTKERLFEDRDMQHISESWELFTQKLVGEQIKQFNGLDDKAFEAAKKNLSLTTDSTTNTSSPNS